MIRRTLAKKVPIAFFSAGLAVLGAWTASTRPAFANGPTFHDISFTCEAGHRLYAHSSYTSIRLIHFTRAGGYSDDARCSSIRGNLHAANATGHLRFITHGIRNGQTILCGVSTFGQSCNSGRYLMTLAHRRTSARTALRNLLYSINTGIGNGHGYVLYDNDSREYIHFSHHLQAALASAEVTPDSAPTSASPRLEAPSPDIDYYLENEPGYPEPEGSFQETGSWMFEEYGE